MNRIMNRRTAIISMAALVLVCCGATAPQGCTSQQKVGFGIKGPIIGAVAIIAVGTIVLVAVHHSHHTLKGCVFAGPNGFQVQADDTLKRYDLSGVTPNIKAGDIVRVSGSKLKKKKDSPDDQIFVVEKVKKDYGPCHPTPTSPADTATP